MTVFEKLRRYLTKQDYRVDYVLYSNYDALVGALSRGRLPPRKTLPELSGSEAKLTGPAIRWVGWAPGISACRTPLAETGQGAETP